MNYPVWELYYLNSGTLIAIIAVLHVFVSHFAVGGGIFLWLTDLKSLRENNQELRFYVRKHIWFFLLITMVFGGVTGVGIWFIIALSSPWATSILIHTFVFAWAIEWVFFIVEIISLLIYHYKFDTLSNKIRLRVAFIYALSAWLSLFVINGIITFMLTPGQWLQTYNFWDGFFNPTNLPSLVFRTGVCIMFAGLFGFITAVFMPQSDFRTKLLKYCAKWLYMPLPFILISGFWYFYSIPENARITNFWLNRQTSNAVNAFLISSVLLYLLTILFIIKTSRRFQQVTVFILLLIGLLWIGGFEYMREYARKPYVIYGYMYSPSVLVKDEEFLNKEGFLKHSKWSKIKEVTEENKIEAGRELFNLQCLSCHSIRGVKNDIIEKTKGFTYLGVLAQLHGQGKVRDYMPRFIGTEKEMEALAAFIVKELNGKETSFPLIDDKITKFKTEIPEFKPSDEYILLAWNTLGMKCASDADKWFSFLSPGNNLEALLIKRGKKPEIITDVEISYYVEKGFENPSKHTDFWNYAKFTFGKEVSKDKGLTGKGLKGNFELDKERGIFKAEGLPVLPYKDDGVYNPYPIFDLTAKDKSTGKILQKTKVVAPVSTEMRCWMCHGGGWRWNNISGISDETSINILKVHDRKHGTRLYESAIKGNPKLCQSCHEDVIVKSKGIKGHNSFSVSMHGLHANYIPFKDERACALCHPDHPKGNTRFNRDIHAKVGLNCTQCHGKLDEHAVSLLLGQENSRTAKILIKNLTPETPVTQINPRKPWINEPDCLNCHRGFQKPENNKKAFNFWVENSNALFRMRFDNTGKIHALPVTVHPMLFIPLSMNLIKQR
jgi:cytochrome bd-type quinol oxidase subunit 1